MNIESILAGLEIYDGKYKREHIEAALKQKEEVIPHLIAILEKVKDEPQNYIEDSDYQAHIYALMLLGHWRETRAHQVIIDLASLPEPIPDELFGDIITENLAVVLLQTCGGSIDKIKELANNKDAYEFSRGAAITAITYAAIEGLITREDALSFLGGLLTKGNAPEGSPFYDQLACSICDLYPEEVMDQVQNAYEQELIDRVFVGIEDFQAALKDGKEKCLADVRKELDRQSLDDIHKVMKDWVCFNDERAQPFTPEPKPPNIPNFSYQVAPKQKKKKAFWEL
ncbi:MAG: DUF1186 domain-containing protein [Pseudanabaena sp.]